MYQAGCNTDDTEIIGNFECHFCAQVFSTDVAMKTHLLSHIKEEPLQGTDEPEVSLEEIPSTSEPDILPSDKIKQEPLDEDEAVGDCYNTNVINFKCSLCGTEFRHRGHYARHLVRHGIENDKIPLFQKNTQVTSPQLKTSRVSSSKKYKCMICGSAYRHRGHYYRHMLRHEKQMQQKEEGAVLPGIVPLEPLPSASETKTRSPKSELVPLSDVTPEKELHTNEGYSPRERYGCTYCNKTFRLKSILNRHLLIHSGIKPYKCSLCGMACARKDNLNLHMAICLQKKKPYKCKVCNEDCKSSGMLRQHMIIHVGEKGVNPEYLQCNRKSLPGRKVEIVKREEILDEPSSSSKEVDYVKSLEKKDEEDNPSYSLKNYMTAMSLERKNISDDSSNSSIDIISAESLERDDKEDDPSNSPKDAKTVKSPEKKDIPDDSPDSPKGVKLAKYIKLEEATALVEDEANSLEHHPYKDTVVIWEDATKISVSVKHLVAHIKRQYIKCLVCGRQFNHPDQLKLHMRHHEGVCTSEYDSPTIKGSVGIDEKMNKSGLVSSSLQESTRVCDSADSASIPSVSQESVSLNEVVCTNEEVSSIIREKIRSHEKGSTKEVSSVSEENGSLHDNDGSRGNRSSAPEGVMLQNSADGWENIFIKIPGQHTMYRKSFRCTLCNRRFKHEGFYRRHMRWHAEKCVSQKASEFQHKEKYTGNYQLPKPLSGIDVSDRSEEATASSSVEEPQNELLETTIINVANIKKEKSEVSCQAEESVNKSPQNSFKCADCDRQFKRPNHLALHMIKTHGKRYSGKKQVGSYHHLSHKCSECDRSFKRGNQLHLHMFRTHGKKYNGKNGESNNHVPLKCSECDQKFKHQALLVLHMNQHTQNAHDMKVLDIKKEDTVASCLEEKVLNVEKEETVASNSEEPRNNVPQTIDKCTKCDQQFKYGQHLYLHMEKCHGTRIDGIVSVSMKKEEKIPSCSVDPHAELLETTVKCPECTLEFTHKYQLALHMMKIHKVKYGRKDTETHKCTDCNQEFTQGKYLTLHMRKHKKKFNVVDTPNIKKEEVVTVSSVELADKVPKDNCSVESNNKVPQVKAKCYECGLEFKHRGHLLLHMRRHRKRYIIYKALQRRKYKSMVSSRPKKSWTGIRENISGKDVSVSKSAVNTEQKDSRNNICEEGVSMSSSIQVKTEEAINKSIPERHVSKNLRNSCKDIHKYVPAQKYRYRCPICPKVFQFPGGIERHLVIHSNEKPFTCIECGKGCNREDNLRLHMKKCFLSRGKFFEYHKRKIEAAEGKKFLPVKPLRYLVCQVCGQGFCRNNLFVRHMVHHNKMGDLLKGGYLQSTKRADFDQSFRFAPIIARRHPIGNFSMKSELRVSLKKLELGTEKTFQVSKQGKGYTVSPDHCVEYTMKKKQGECKRCGGAVEQNCTSEGGKVATECKACEEVCARKNGEGTVCELERSKSETAEVELQSRECMLQNFSGFEDTVQKAKAPEVKIQELKSFRKLKINIYDFEGIMHICIFCSKKFKTKTSLSTHVYQHLNGKSSDFRDWNGDANDHRFEYFDNFITKCSICGKVFANCDNLEIIIAQHMKNHLTWSSSVFLRNQYEESYKERKDSYTNGVEEKPLKSSGQNGTVHSHIKPADMIPLLGKHKINYSCHKCGKVFIRKFGIKEHLMEQCEETNCEKDVSSNDDIGQHLSSHAQHETHIDCVICGKLFVKFACSDSMVTVPVCMKCEEKSVKIRTVESRRIVHKCNLCRKRCNGLRGLSIHMAYHSKRKNRGLKCFMKNKKFTLKSGGAYARKLQEFKGLKKYAKSQKKKNNVSSLNTKLEPGFPMQIYSDVVSAEGRCDKDVQISHGTVSSNSQSCKTESNLVVDYRVQSSKHHHKVDTVDSENTPPVLSNIHLKSEMYVQNDVKGIVSDSSTINQISQRTHTPTIMTCKVDGIGYHRYINQPVVENNKTGNNNMSPLNNTTVDRMRTENHETHLELRDSTTTVNSHSKEIKGVLLTDSFQSPNVTVQLKPTSEKKSVLSCQTSPLNVTNHTASKRKFIQICPKPVTGPRILPAVVGLKHLSALLNKNNFVKLPQGIARSETCPQPLPRLMLVNTGVRDYKVSTTNNISTVRFAGVAKNTNPSSSVLSQSDNPIKIVVKSKMRSSSENSTDSSLAPNLVRNPENLETLSTPVNVSRCSSGTGNTSATTTMASPKSHIVQICTSLSQPNGILRLGPKPLTVVRSPENKLVNLSSSAAGIKDSSNSLPVTVNSGQVTGEPVKAVMQINKVLLYPDAVRTNMIPSTYTSSNTSSGNFIGSSFSYFLKNQIGHSNNTRHGDLPVATISSSFNYSVGQQPIKIVSGSYMTGNKQDGFSSTKEIASPSPSPNKREKVDGPKEKKVSTPKERKKVSGPAVGKVSTPKERTVDTVSTTKKRKKVGDSQVEKVSVPEKKKKVRVSQVEKVSSSKKRKKMYTVQIEKAIDPFTETNYSSAINSVASSAVKDLSVYCDAEEDFDQALMDLGKPILLDDIEIKEEETDLAELSMEDFEFWEAHSPNVPNDILLENLWVKEKVPEKSGDVP